jgi:AAT family amino acid transporter
MAQERIVEQSDRTLNRGIMPWHVSLIALGGIIGSCYFLELGYTFNEMGPGAILITYAVAGITIYGVMQSFAELLVNIPRRGSFVSYTREFMGDTASAGIGWAFWANWVCYIPSEALATAIFVNALIKNINPAYESTPMLTFLWGIIALALLTLINIFHVKWFGHLESILAIIKIFAIILFIIFGVLIFFGVTNSGAHFEGNDMTADIGAGFVGTQALLPNMGEEIMHQLFPRGGVVMITLMIWTLVNFQGSEIVGLSAAETQNPEVNVPAACKKVAYRIILIYLVPIFVLSLIMPYTVATLDSSVFAQALAAYGFQWGSSLFTVVTLIAAFSCANSGFYGTVRSLYGLSVEGLAPKFLSKLNRYSTPQNATLFTLVFIWIVFVISFQTSVLGNMGGEDNMLYTALVGIAGFTGTLCWVGILYSQILMRKRLKERGYNPKEALTVKAALFPVLEWFAIILQVAAMVLLVFEVGDGIPIFLLSMDIIIAPIVVFAIQKYRGKIRQTIVIGADEMTFDMKFPAKPGSVGEKKDAERAARKQEVGGGSPWIILLVAVCAVSIILSFVTIINNPAEIAEGYNIFSDPAMTKVWALMVVEIVTYAVIFFGTMKLGKRTGVAEDVA